MRVQLGFIVLWSVTFAIIYSTEHKTLPAWKKMYVPVNLCLCGRSCAGRGGKGRKGKKEREEGKGGRKGRKERELEGGAPYIYQYQKGHTTTISALSE